MSRSARVAVMASLVCFGSLAARAGDAPRYPVDLRETWKVGDVVTRTVEASQEMRIAGAPAKELADTLPPEKLAKAATSSRKTERLAATVVERCEAVEGERPTRLTVHVAAWAFEATESAKDGAEPPPPTRDVSIEGARLEVTGTGPGRRWVFVGAAPMPSPKARSWLDKAYGPKKRSSDLSGMVGREGPKDMAVGETWSPSAADLAGLLPDEMPVDAAKVSISVRLESVREGVATFVAEMSLPLRGFPLGKGKGKGGTATLPWTRGGVATSVVTRIGPLDPAVHAIEERQTMSIDGEAEMTGLLSFTLSLSSTRRDVVVPGGELPPLPEATEETK